MSDPTATKRLTAEARATCAQLDGAAKKLLAWANMGGDGEPVVVLISTADLRALGLALAHQGGRLDMAASMAHTRAKRRKT